jgi:epsilon-lactone hydrolase
LSGDSAGGGLALALVLSLRDEGQELPAGCILLSPWLDLGRDRRAVPDLVHRDVLLIQAATDELLAPDAELLAASASAAGVDVTYTRWPRMWHDFVLQPGLLAAADSALAQAAWFVGQVTAGSSG